MEFGAPSFSLGLDFDFDTQLPESDPVVFDSDPETGSEPPRILRRLRRVGQDPSGNVVEQREPRGGGLRFNEDDDIEDFSEEEERDGLLSGGQPSTLPRSVCSSSKVPLKANGVLTPQVSTQRTSRNRTQVSDAIPTKSSVPGCNQSKRPKLASSPLRMFQLIDSDSDDYSVGEDRDADLIGGFSKPYTTASDRKGAKEVNSEDLWKDFPIKSVPTPAFDEVFKEYFHSEKNKNMPHKPANSTSTGVSDVEYQRTCHNQNTQQEWNLSDAVPPAHNYFLHDDPRIQNLVRSRLPNFQPLGISNNRGNMQASTSVINYMSQFGSGDSSKAKTANSRAKGNSVAARNKRKKKQTEEVSEASGNWVNPRSGSTLPKDAGQRRVHADGQCVGHWYSGPDGKKVYVTKNGQELTGQAAYRNYKKESGGFKKSRKKTSSKKKRGKG